MVREYMVHPACAWRKGNYVGARGTRPGNGIWLYDTLIPFSSRFTKEHDARGEVRVAQREPAIRPAIIILLWESNNTLASARKGYFFIESAYNAQTRADRSPFLLISSYIFLIWIISQCIRRFSDNYLAKSISVTWDREFVWLYPDKNSVLQLHAHPDATGVTRLVQRQVLYGCVKHCRCSCNQC